MLSTAYLSKRFISLRKQGNPIEVRLGKAINNMKRGVLRIYVHENYNSSVDFNIGVWLLDEAVAFGFNIQPICLPNSSFVDYTGKLVTAAGWSKSKSSFVSMSKLHQILIPIWTDEQCNEVSDYANEITDNMICVGEYEDGIRRACVNDVRYFYRKYIDSYLIF